MVPGNKAHVFKKGDLVKWWYSSPIIPHAINKENERSWTDIGIVLSVENWEEIDFTFAFCFCFQLGDQTIFI